MLNKPGKYISGLLFLAVMVFGAYASASATSYSYGFVPVTYNQGEEIVAGLAENFSLEVEDFGDAKVGFKILSFLNDDAGGDDFSITDIYFYADDILDADHDVEIASYGNVAFSPEKVAPKDLPGLKTDIALAYSADSDVPVPQNGVNVDEWISFLFFLEDGKSIDDVLRVLDETGCLSGSMSRLLVSTVKVLCLPSPPTPPLSLPPHPYRRRSGFWAPACLRFWA